MSSIVWSISVRDATTHDALYERHPDRVLRTASIGKLLLLVHVAGLIRDRQLDLAQPLTRTSSDAVADSGIWQYLDTPTLPVGDLCELIGMASDNLATNVLIARVGLAAVADTAARIGLRNTTLHDRVRDVRTPADPPTLSTGSAGDLTRLMIRLHRGATGGEEVGSRVLGWLAKGLDLSQVAAGWNLDPLAHRSADRGLSAFNKTGTDDDVRAEVGVLIGPARTIAYAVLANWDQCSGDRRDPVLAEQRRIGVLLARCARGESPGGPELGQW